MIESQVTSIPARAAPAVDHRHVGYLEDLISRIAAGDRAAFRLLYAFMAMRVWRTVTETPLGLADAVAVTRSTFVEVWHLAGAAAGYDACEWITAVSTRRVTDRLRAIDATDAIVANGGRSAWAAQPTQPHPAADSRGRPPADAEYDAHIHDELTALLGGGHATVRIGPGVFTRIDDLEHALATIAAAT
jgi:hypothetical protein